IWYAPLAAKSRRGTRREPRRIDSRGDRHDPIRLQAKLEEPAPIRLRVNDDAVAPPQRPEPQSQCAGLHVDAPLRSAHHAQIRALRPRRRPQREMMVVRETRLEDVEPPFPRPPRERSGLV